MTTRRTVQQAAQKVESAIATIMSREDIGFAVDDLRQARDLLNKLHEDLVKEAAQKPAHVPCMSCGKSPSFEASPHGHPLCQACTDKLKAEHALAERG
jgi:hypothetical protein